MSTSYFPKTSMCVVCRKERGRDVSTFLFYACCVISRFKGFHRKFKSHIEGWKKIYDSNVSVDTTIVLATGI